MSIAQATIRINAILYIYIWGSIIPKYPGGQTHCIKSYGYQKREELAEDYKLKLPKRPRYSRIAVCDTIQLDPIRALYAIKVSYSVQSIPNRAPPWAQRTKNDLEHMEMICQPESKSSNLTL
ncbi:hypothetical protein TWF706_009547 [Orbilia oligospora]|nr:hypothetical protein TWF706_009547 [Orbilia oligospora]